MVEQITGILALTAIGTGIFIVGAAIGAGRARLAAARQRYEENRQLERIEIRGWGYLVQPEVAREIADLNCAARMAMQAGELRQGYIDNLRRQVGQLEGDNAALLVRLGAAINNEGSKDA